MTHPTDDFGVNVFNDKVMRQRLPREIYKALRQTMQERTPLTSEVADVVATAMKEWAVEKGVTHFTHWFQPMTGMTAEKHEAFLTPVEDGRVVLEFSGKELVRGESDASSLPSGGLRATFEARGYTAWDPTSYAFIKGGVLCIPTAFCSYNGESLDKKTPLLRSMQAIDKQARRILRLFGEVNTGVVTTVGAEQEYFLIDKSLLDLRPDLLYCGRTLLGARPPKGQDMDDHFFGAIKPRVQDYMRELDEKLWKLGVTAKTEHNETAPAQHEMAPVFSTANIATDHNQLTMEVMKIVAERHGMLCLLHEKPFAGVNGSGKHNNWSLSTDKGENLLEPGKTPRENARFLLMLSAVIKAVDEHQALLRLSVATAGNDHRLGAGEAPPAIISMFIGDELGEIVEAIKTGATYKPHRVHDMEIGVDALPHFPKDTTDRNRTSPFAFTGNKFEFRMPGSSLSIAGPNFILNTIVAESFRQFADILEQAEDFQPAMERLIRDTLRRHERIIFNGNNYAAEWVTEAERRGLLNLRSTVDALPLFRSEESVALFERHGVLSRSEINSRTDMLTEVYIKTLHIEALTMLDMVRKQIVPAVISYKRELADALQSQKEISPEFDCVLESALLERLCKLSTELSVGIQGLDQSVRRARELEGCLAEQARFYHDEVLAAMSGLREIADALELIFDRDRWPFPSYGQMLNSIR